MTYNVELIDKPDKRGLHHIMIRLHVKEQKPARIQTEIEIQYRYWNPKKKWGAWVRSAHPHADKLNKQIEQVYTTIKDAITLLINANSSLTPKQAKDRYEASNLTLLKEYPADTLTKPANSFSTNEAKQFTWNAFLRWAGEELSVENITPTLLGQYVNKLQAEGKKNSTINAYMGDLRDFYVTLQQQRGLTLREIAATSPFLEWKSLKVVATPKGRLHSKGIEQMQGKPFTLLSEQGSALYGSMVDWARWCWLACLYMAGMRIGDLIRARYEWFDVDIQNKPIRLKYQMQKNGRLMSLPLSTQTQNHLLLIWKPNASPEHYLLPFLENEASYAPFRSYEQIRKMPREVAKLLKSKVSSKTAQLNAALKLAIKELNIEAIGGAILTNHTARHSFGDKVRLSIKNGKTDAKGRPITIFDAKDLFGHRFMSTTEQYFGQMDQEMLDDAMDAVWE